MSFEQVASIVVSHFLSLGDKISKCEKLGLKRPIDIQTPLTYPGGQIRSTYQFNVGFVNDIVDHYGWNNNPKVLAHILAFWFSRFNTQLYTMFYKERIETIYFAAYKKSQRDIKTLWPAKTWPGAFWPIEFRRIRNRHKCLLPAMAKDPAVVGFTEFLNKAVDNLDDVAEYIDWSLFQRQKLISPEVVLTQADKIDWKVFSRDTGITLYRLYKWRKHVHFDEYATVWFKTVTDDWTAAQLHLGLSYITIISLHNSYYTFMCDMMQSNLAILIPLIIAGVIVFYNKLC